MSTLRCTKMNEELFVSCARMRGREGYHKVVAGLTRSPAACRLPWRWRRTPARRFRRCEAIERGENGGKGRGVRGQGRAGVVKERGALMAALTRRLPAALKRVDGGDGRRG